MDKEYKVKNVQMNIIWPWSLPMQDVLNIKLFRSLIKLNFVF